MGEKPTFVGGGRPGWYQWECHNPNAVPVEFALRCPATGATFRLLARPGRSTRRFVPGGALGHDSRLTILTSGDRGDTQNAFRRVSRFAAWLGLWSRLRQLDRDFRGLSRFACLRVWLSWLVSRRARESALRRYERTCSSLPIAAEYSSWLRHESERRLKSDVLPTVGGQGQVPAICFSFLMPVATANPALLRETLDSLRSQSFAHWALCVVLRSDADDEVRQVLVEASEQDARVSLLSWAEALSTMLNRGLSGCAGDYVALLGGEDRLAPDALMTVALVLRAAPGLQMLYADEDTLSGGERFDPHFKPDWNPDLALAYNYVSRLCVYRRDRLLALGGFREGFADAPGDVLGDALEDAWEHDLLLRFTRGLAPEQIHHVPQVLYHRRAEDYAERSVTGEDRRARSGLRVVSDYLAEVEPAASVEPSDVPCAYRVRWPRPDPPPLVSLIIPTRDGVEILRPCVDAILERTDYPNLEILVVDNESRCPQTLAYLDQLKRDARVRVLEWHRPFNFSAINNHAVAQARGDLIGLINNDIEPINPDWLDEMVRQACRPEIGCVGAKLYYPNGRIQHAGVILGIGGVAGHGHKHLPREHPGYFSRLKLAHNVSAVTAACLLVRRSVFDEVGGLDEQNLPVAYNDVDFSLKVREAGYRNLWTPYAEAYHHESVSRGGRDTPEKRRRFKGEITYMRTRWGKALDNDPAYNPNLTLAHEDFSLR